MNEKKLIAVVVIVAFALCGTLSLGIVCRSKMKAAARAKDIVLLADTFGRSIAKSNKLVARREFEAASAALRELEAKITTMRDANLEEQLQRAMWNIDEAKRDYRAKLSQGYSIFEGEFISKEEKDRIVGERERRQAAERERLAAEAKARAEREGARKRLAKERVKAEVEEARTEKNLDESAAPSGGKLYVQGKDVTVREAPSMSAPVILTVNNGHEVIEITRQGSWVEVGVARTGKIGWIPASSLGTDRHGGATATPVTPQFKRFKAAFEKLNSRIKSATGVTFFTHAEDMGDGILWVTATETWLSGATADRESNLRMIYEMWRAAEGSGLPIAVYVLDERGKTVMKLSGE